MHKQMPLLLDLTDRERRQRLWKQIPKKDRAELAMLYAKSIAKAIRLATSARGKEVDREVTHD